MAIEYTPELFNQANSLMEKGIECWHSQSYEQCINYCLQAVDLYLTIEETDLPPLTPDAEKGYHPPYSQLARCYNLISMVYKVQGNYPLAVHYSLKSLDIADTYGIQDNFKASIIKNLSIIYFRMGKYSQSIEYINQALLLHTELQDEQSIADDLNTLATIFSDLGDVDQSIDYFQQALAIHEKAQNYQRIQQIMANIGICFIEHPKSSVFDPEQARRGIEFLYKALAVQSADDYTYSVIKYNMAQGHILLQQIDLALPLLYEALAFFEENSLQDYIAACLNTIAIILMDGDNHHCNKKLAEEYLLRAVDISRQTQSSVTLSKSCYYLHQFYAQNKIWEKAFFFLNEYHQHHKILLHHDNLLTLEKLKMQLLEKQKSVLQKKNDELVALNNEKNEFMNIAVHDLKNPLHSIQFITHLIIENPTIDIADRNKFITEILHLSGRMYQIIIRLLDINVLDQGQKKIVCEAISISSILLHMTDIYKVRAAQKRISLRLYLQNPDTEYMAWCDLACIQQILDNLLSNALKFSTPDSSVIIRCSHHQKMIRIEIQDQGPGLTPQDHQLLFTRFAHLSARATAGEHSTGLGLFIAKRLSNMMNAALHCASTQGNGATFILDLPMAA
jgi:signal transduction histidine kinase